MPVPGAAIVTRGSSPEAFRGRTKITILVATDSARQPSLDVPERRRATTQLGDRPSVRSRYSLERVFDTRLRTVSQGSSRIQECWRTSEALLDLDGGAGGLEGLGSLLGGLLGDLLDDGLRGAVHEVLGLLQT